VGRSNSVLPTPSEDGIIRFIGPVPIEGWSEGTYDVDLKLHGWQGICAEKTQFTLVP